MKASLTGCTYFIQNDAGEFITGEHCFEDDGICHNCGTKERVVEQKEQQLPVEVVEQGMTANV